MAISNYIEELLYKYSCVIIPEFGGLITNERSSYINYQRQLIHPPGMNIAFNRNLSVNDGLLASHLSDKQNISYTSSLQLIQQFVEDLNKNLQEGKREELDKIGSFQLSEEQKIQFKPEAENFLTPEFYGLSPVNAVIVHKEEQQQEQQQKQAQEKRQEQVQVQGSKEKEVIISSDQKKSNPALIYIPSVAAGLVILFFVYSYFNNTSPKKNSTNIKATSAASVFSLDDLMGYADTFPYPVIQSSPETTVPADTVFIGSVDKKPEPNTIKNNKIEPGKTYARTFKKYQIVAGIFRNEENAVKYVEELKNKGFNASLIRIGSGKYRVIMGDYGSKGEAENELTEAKKYNQDAWILTL